MNHVFVWQSQTKSKFCGRENSIPREWLSLFNDELRLCNLWLKCPNHSSHQFGFEARQGNMKQAKFCSQFINMLTEYRNNMNVIVRKLVFGLKPNKTQTSCLAMWPELEFFCSFYESIHYHSKALIKMGRWRVDLHFCSSHSH